MERIWIYPCDRKLSEKEKSELSAKLEHFVKNVWAAHNVKLKAAYQIPYDHFIILSVDQEEVTASGCSIDSSVHFMQQIQKEYGLDFFNRQRMMYLKEGEIKSCTLSEIKDLHRSGELTEDTEVFNNTVSDSLAMQRSWKQPFRESGYKMFA
jgi:hypothetical protein